MVCFAKDPQILFNAQRDAVRFTRQRWTMPRRWHAGLPVAGPGHNPISCGWRTDNGNAMHIEGSLVSVALQIELNFNGLICAVLQSG